MQKSKNHIGIIYLLLLSFSLFLVTPGIVSVIDDSHDVSFVFNMNEEEEKSQKDRSVEELLKLKFDALSEDELLRISKEKEKAYFSFTNNYDKVYIEILSPPPELG